MGDKIMKSDISSWYSDKTIFVTGGTGFLGKVLLEKLMRACHVKRIYMLIRPKKGVDIQQRIENMMKLPVFDKVRLDQPEMLKCVVPVRGDITTDGLGLSPEDEAKLAKEVHVIFHVAATVNFQEPMKVSVDMNMLGTRRVVALAHKMSSLKALVHVSTAYSNCHLPETHEKLYSPPTDPERFIQLIDWLDDDMLQFITPKLVAPRPNTYSYTKVLAEHILVKDIGKIPYTIVRPSIVSAAWKEPVPGWVDSLFGPTGLQMAWGIGVLRSWYLLAGGSLDLIPVDICINTMIASAWNVDVQRFRINGEQVYSCSTSSQNPLKNNSILDFVTSAINKYPFNSVIWWPGGSAKFSKLPHQIHLFLMHIIPAYITDGILKVFLRKPFAVKRCNNLVKTLNAYEYFMTHSWSFHNTNTTSLYESLSPVDKQVFNFDVSQLEWKEYIGICQLGIKKYLLKEPMSRLNEAHKKMNRLWWLNFIVQLIMMYGAWCLISSDTAWVLYSTFFQGVSFLSHVLHFLLNLVS